MKLSKRLQYALETGAVYLLYGFFKLLPPDAASATGGWIGRRIGPHLSSTQTARENLRHAFPEKSEALREKIIIGMWDNLGRVFAEYPHLHHIWPRVELHGAQALIDARDGGKPAIFCAGHLANWEINAIAAKQHGLSLHLVYRKPNNPGVDGLLRRARDSGAAGHIKKGAGGAREMLSILRKKGSLGVLFDQKLNEGIPVPFFGRPAMTAPAIAHFALKFGCKLYPARVERTDGCHFRMTIDPPLEFANTGDTEADARAIMTALNARLESWVRARPEQWLWIHNRWS